VGILVKPLAGGLSDHFPPLQVSAGVLLLGAVGMTVVVGSSLSLLLGLGVILFAAGVMAFPPVMQAYLMNVFPTKSMGGDLGGARTIYLGIGSLGPTYVGAVADILGFEYAFISLIGCLLISGLVVFALVLLD
jgi:MFS family permease